MTEANLKRGAYESLDINVWKLIETKGKTDYRGRIHTAITYYKKLIMVFVSDTDQDLEIRDNLYLLPHTLYTEVRKTRNLQGVSVVGDPLTVQKNGDVYTTQPNKYVKIFVQVN